MHSAIASPNGYCIGSWRLDSLRGHDKSGGRRDADGSLELATYVL